MSDEEEKGGRPWPLWFVACIIIAAIAFWAHGVRAHDHQHPELGDWYAGLTGRGPCCDGSESEMRHLSDVEWRNQNGHYQVYINQFMDGSGENRWIDVPDDAVVKGPNRDGRTLVWPIWGTDPRVRCFMPGTMS